MQRDSALATFVRRVSNSKNARFIMTTRAHIFEEARRISDYVDHEKFQLAKYLLDVGAYTRKVKAYILFNHLSVSNLSVGHFAALLEDGWLKRIVDHKNYNPRVIASASSDNFNHIEPAEYPAYLLSSLEKPDLIWSKPYGGLDIKSRNLLVALFFSSDYGTKISILNKNFRELHRRVCAYYSQPTLPSDFEDALRSLESGFVTISDQQVSFINPSLKDFLKTYLVDLYFMQLLPETATRADWANALWKHISRLFKTNSDIMAEFARRFLLFAELIHVTPTMKRVKEGYFTSLTADDLCLADRIELLLEWWSVSRIDRFLLLTVEMIESKCLELDTARDGSSIAWLYSLIETKVPDDNPYRIKLLNGIRAVFNELIARGPSIDELPRLYESFYEYMNPDTENDLRIALSAIVAQEFTNIDQIIKEIESEDDLTDHLMHLEDLAEKAGHDVSQAREAVHEPMAYIEWKREADEEERRPSFSERPSFAAGDQFDDDQMKSLFSNIVH